MTHPLRKHFIPVFGPSILFGVAEGAYIPALSIKAHTLGMSAPEIATLVALIGFASMVSNIPASRLAMQYGEKIVILLATLVASVGLVCASFGEHPFVLITSAILLGIATSAYNLARQSYLTENVDQQYRARALSTLGGSMRIGVFCGPLFSALLMPSFGLEIAFWLGLLAMVVASLLARLLPETQKLNSIVGEVPHASPRLGQTLKQHWFVFITLGVGVLGVSAVRACRNIILPIWALHLGMSASESSLIFALSTGVDMLLFYPAGKVMDALGRLWVIIPSLLLMACGFAAISLLNDSYAVFYVAALLVGIGNGLGSGMIMTLGADSSSSRHRTSFLGVWRLLADVGTSSGPAVLSAVTAATSLKTAVLTSALGTFITLSWLVFWVLRFQHGRLLPKDRNPF